MQADTTSAGKAWRALPAKKGEAMALLHSDGDALGLAAREVLAEVRT